MTKNKKIIHFHPHGTMASIFVAPLVDFERSLGCQSTLVTSIHETKFQEENIPYDVRLSHLLYWPLAFVRLCLLLWKIKPDLVISHNSKSSLMPLLVAFLFRVPVRIYFNHGVPFLGYTGLFKHLLVCLERLNFLFSTEVITVCEDMQAALLSVNQSIKISLIGPGSACGLDLSLYDPNQYQASSFRAQHGIGLDDCLTVFVGRAEMRKGFDVALRLWASHFKESGHCLVLCGPTAADVKDVLGELPTNVISLGFVKNIPEILAAADCLILPSQHEGLPYSILESMASACVVVANDIPGVRCLIQSGTNGFLVAQQSVDEYARVIAKIAHSTENDLKPMRLAAMKKAQTYSRNYFMDAYRQQLNRWLYV